MIDSPLSPSYRLGVLLFAFGPEGDLLLIKRSKKPNRGHWCAVGGKLEMDRGESPYECALREAKEEIGIDLEASDLDLSCILSEKNYEDSGHWLMFVFEVRKPVLSLPADIEEGEFSFFKADELSNLDMPKLDERILRERILNKAGPRFSVITVDGGKSPIEDSAFIEEELY